MPQRPASSKPLDYAQLDAQNNKLPSADERAGGSENGRDNGYSIGLQQQQQQMEAYAGYGGDYDIAYVGRGLNLHLFYIMNK